MKITTSSDWRSALPFETPLLASEAVPGEPARCIGCGPDIAARERTELWAVKHRHPNDPAGFVRFYCETHRPVMAAPAAARDARSRAAAPRRERTTRPAAPTIPARVAALCPNCFIEVPQSGVCGMCGEQVA